jgi:hypothetical protein
MRAGFVVPRCANRNPRPISESAVEEQLYKGHTRARSELRYVGESSWSGTGDLQAASPTSFDRRKANAVDYSVCDGCMCPLDS